MPVTQGKVLINIEVTPKEREYIKYVARLHNLPMATYVRMQAMQPIERSDDE